jgi:mRNA interferase RelE/StbE
VGTLSNFLVAVNKKVESEDFPNLPMQLQKDFRDLFVEVLAEDPYSRCGLDGHSLKRELRGFETLDIKYLGEAYRIVYRIDDRPEAMRVDVYAFDRHDPAYDKAKNRALGWR